MPDPHHELTTFLARVRRRWLAHAWMRACGRGALLAAAPLVAALAVDRIVHPQGLTLVFLAGAALALACGLAGAVVMRRDRRPGDGRLARFVEEQLATAPEPRQLDDVLVTAVAVRSSADEGGPFRSALAAAAMRSLDGIAPEDVLPPRGLRVSAAVALAGLLGLAFVGWRATPMLGSASETAWLTWSPQSIQFEVLPGDARVAAGRPFTIRAVLRVRGRALSTIEPTLVVAAGTDRRTVPMQAVRDGFEFAFDSIDRTFTYQIAARSRTSPTFTVSALFPPKIQRIDAHYEYPAFSGLAPRDTDDGGDVYAPQGTRVRLQVHTDKPIASGQMRLSSGTDIGLLRKAGDRLLETDLVLTRNDAYRLQLADTDGLQGGADTEYFIRLMDDRPPDVRILRPNGDQQITPLEEVAIEARADDDYGIAAFDLVYAVAGQPERATTFSRVSGTNVARIGGHLLSAEDLRVQPGDVITYYARARDIGRGKRPTEAKSDMFFLEVRPFNEEFVSAESQAMAASGDPQLESLISAQKEIINATWTIERRSAAGRSAEDLRSVSQAQTELRAKAQRISRGARGGSPFQMPQQIGVFGQRRAQSAGADAVTSAIRSMGLAVQQLDGDKTKEAIPHEMDALRGLLQAQAEIRRRQVAQQANGASGNGSGRQGQDLSALFDKELQRQQRTNYETRSQIEERPDSQQGDDALERIRDLARRQEDLSSRERDLARSQASAEEKKRELDKLAREQQELHERAEAIRRQLDSVPSRNGAGESGGGSPGRRGQGQRADGQASPAGAAAAGGGQGGGQGSSGGEMRDAAEQMRSAATDLQRQDPAAAAARAERAAGQLRQMEQRLRKGSPDAAQRASADVSLEAQQIIEAQRRIGDEAARLAAGRNGAAGASDADARRRIAAEKTALADRVDALERAARSIGQGRGADPSARAAADAAAALRRDQIGDRMRASANEMRDGRGSAEARAHQEQELARALDKAAGRLGGATSADARSLSQQLDESRAIRDRLDGLQQQIREAEARQQQAGQPGGRSSGASGPSSTAGSPGDGAGAGSGSRSLQQLRDEYARELTKAQGLLARMSQGQPRGGLEGGTPEEQVFSGSAPGNEAFKQDRSNWESLRKGVDLALERYETSVSRRLAKKLAEDRLSAGGSQRGPDAYERLIARYYESLARTKQ